MSRFSDSVENDSFDDILATMDVPSAKTQSTQAKGASPAKKSRLSFENDDGVSDSMLANVVMPEASTSTNQAAKPINVPISAGKTNCVLVNPKQRGTSLTFYKFILIWHKIIKNHFYFFRQSNSQINYECSMGI